jgi:hypothetical protein
MSLPTNLSRWRYRVGDRLNRLALVISMLRDHGAAPTRVEQIDAAAALLQHLARLARHRHAVPHSSLLARFPAEVDRVVWHLREIEADHADSAAVFLRCLARELFDLTEEAAELTSSMAGAA